MKKLILLTLVFVCTSFIQAMDEKESRKEFCKMCSDFEKKLYFQIQSKNLRKTYESKFDEITDSSETIAIKIEQLNNLNNQLSLEKDTPEEKKPKKTISYFINPHKYLIK